MLKHTPLAFAGAALLALPLQALPSSDRYDWDKRDYRWERNDRGQDHGPENRLVDKYDRFAGSDRNARELVEGLRNDSQIDLTKGGKTTSFKPATDKMGYGNVDLALGLAKASLAEHGIHNPTPEQIKAALNGGAITTKSGQRVTLPGVLKLRASGMGWGQVAHKLGVKVGDVKGHGHGHKKDDDKHHHKHAKHDRDDDDDRHHHDRKHAKQDKHRHDWKDKHHDRDDDDDRHHYRKHVKHDAKHKHDKHEWKHDRKHHDRDHGDRHDHRKQAHPHKPDWKHDRHERKQEHVKHQHHRPELHRAKFERPERAHRPEKIERPHRPERPERPERHHHRR